MGRLSGSGAAARRIAGAALVGATGVSIVVGVASARLADDVDVVTRLPHTLAVAASPVRLEPGYVRERWFTGRVEAARESAIGFESEGRLAQVLVDEGDRIGAGEPLARLDTARLEARRAELEAELQRDQARLALGRLTHQRLARLTGEGAASQQALDDAREGLRALESAVQLARARLDSNSVELEKASLEAPFDAVVVARLADEGRVVAGGQPILRLMELAPPEARIGVAGAALDGLDAGESLAVEILGATRAASVKAVLPVRSVGERTVDVVLALDLEPLAVRRGDLVRLELSQAVGEPGFWVPLGALSEGRRGLWSVLVAEPLEQAVAGMPSHRVSRRMVEVVHQTADRVFVRGPVGDGELLIDAGVHRVVANQRVRVAAGDLP